MGIGAGLAALAFWGFVATVVVAGIWDNIRKREAQHETIRRLIESGQPLDQELMAKLSLVSNGGEKRHDQEFYITGYWLLPISVGMAIFAFFLGSVSPEALPVLLGVSGLLASMGIGALVAGKIVGRWYSSDGDPTSSNPQR